jgi:predicted nucleic acid-binding protein
VVDTPVLFDTNILIDYLSSQPQARMELDRYSDRAISIITWMEVMVGSTAADEDRTRAFLFNFQTLALTSEVAERAFRVRRARKIKLPDAVLQATAEVSGRTLVTRNTRDFPRGTAGVRIPYTL